MGITSVLHIISNKVADYNNGIFSFPVEKQKKYIKHFTNPIDNIERSFFQYKCQMKLNKHFIVSLVLNVASIPMILYYVLKKNDIGELSTKNAVFIADGKPTNIVPRELLDIVGGLERIDNKKELLTNEDRRYFGQLFRRYPFSWYFLLKCLINIRYYGYLAHYYNPKYIIVCHEYSFSSSVMTDYCEKKGIQHINVMHGEKLYYMRDSFFCFHRCYVWDEYYIDLFKKLRAKKDQFIVAVPFSLQFEHSYKNKSIDYTYYLGAEKNEELKTIIANMRVLHDKGFYVAIRPHPRYTNLEQVKKMAQDVEIEDTVNWTIEQSLGRTNHAIAAYSTVLNQAYHNGVNVVIDDLTNGNQYALLKTVGYIMIYKDHQLLSKLLEKD